MFYRGFRLDEKAGDGPSAIERTTVAARRSLAALLALTFGVMATVALERWSSDRHLVQALQRIQASESAGNTVLKRLSSVDTALARFVGEPDARSRTAYLAARAQFDTALANVKAFDRAATDPAVIKNGRIADRHPIAGETDSDVSRFAKATLLHADQLRDHERRIVSYAEAGLSELAVSLMFGNTFTQTRERLIDALGAMVENASDEVRLDLARKQRQGQYFFLAILYLSGVSGLVFWLYLTRTIQTTAARAKAEEERLQTLTRTIETTGMLNETAFQDEVGDLLSAFQAGRIDEDQCIALISIDIQGVRAAGSHIGRAAARYVLVEAARRIRASLTLRDAPVYGHLDTTHIAIATLVAGREEAVRLAERISATIISPVSYGDETIDMSCSIGIALAADGSFAPETLIRQAQVANAADTGAGAILVYDRELDEALQRRIRILHDIDIGIERGEFVPFLQPLVDLKSGVTVGYEMLARWNKPDDGILAPSVFIHHAEEAGRLPTLTWSLFEPALSALREQPGAPFLSFNVSPEMLADPWLTSRIMDILRKTGFPAERLEIEITETALVHDLEAARTILEDLKAIGISAALDDFGTGYSSLSILSNLPVDKVKIDRSFVQSLDRVESLKVVDAIMGLAKALNLKTTAEGLETAEVVDTIRDAGCDIGQGFYWSKPVPLHEIDAVKTTQPLVQDYKTVA